MVIRLAWELSKRGYKRIKTNLMTPGPSDYIDPRFHLTGEELSEFRIHYSLLMICIFLVVLAVAIITDLF